MDVRKGNRPENADEIHLPLKCQDLHSVRSCNRKADPRCIYIRTAALSQSMKCRSVSRTVQSDS